MKRVAILAVAGALSACGGSSSNNLNAAANTKFSYGTSTTPASSTVTSSASSQLSALVTASSSTTPASVQSATQLSTITDSLLTTSNVSYLVAGTAPQFVDVAQQALAVSQQGLMASNFDNPGCVTQPTPTSVNFSNCTTTSTSSGITETDTINGSFAVANGTATWSATMRAAVSESGVTVNANATFAGTMTVTSTTAKGSMEDDVSVTASANGQNYAAEVSESVALDVTYDGSRCIDGGTLEAKRVWVTKPNVQGNYANQGALVTWTGCGAATVAFSN